MFSAYSVKCLRTKQLHHTKTRPRVYSNDKRIVPSGGKHFRPKMGNERQRRGAFSG